MRGHDKRMIGNKEQIFNIKMIDIMIVIGYDKCGICVEACCGATDMAE